MSTAKGNTVPGLIRCRLRITLLGIEPPVWRLVEVPGSLSLGGLHEVIQRVMGWEDAHLHDFVSSMTPPRKTYGPGGQVSWFGSRDIDEDRVAVSQVLKDPSSELYYRYDFGDCWEHEIRVEERLEVPVPDLSIRCLDGRRACPPEDSGGPWGYMEALDIMQSRASDEAEDLDAWYADFDPERFDRDEVQKELESLDPGDLGQVTTIHPELEQPERQLESGIGRLLFREPLRRAGPKIAANEPCPCGSGRKYKKCCRP